MKLNMLHQGGIAYMVIRLDEGDNVDDLGVGMLRNNHIPGLLPMAKRYEYGADALYYTISSLTPLSQSYAVLGNEKRLVRFLKDYCMILKNCEDYLLDSDKLLLHEDYVFIKAVTGELSVPYVSVLDANLNTDANSFFMSFVHQVVPHLPPESAILPILYEQNFRGEFKPDDLIRALSKLEGGSRQKDRKMQVVMDAPLPPPVKVPTPQAFNQPAPQPVNPVSGPVISKDEDQPISTSGGGKRGGGLFGFLNSGKGRGKGKNSKPSGANVFSRSDNSANIASNSALPWDNPFSSAETPASAQNTPPQQSPSPASRPALGSNPASPEVSPNQTPWGGVQQKPASMPGWDIPAHTGPRSGYTINWSGTDSGVPGGTIRMPDEDADEMGFPMKGKAPVLWLVRRGDGHREQITHSNYHVGRKQGTDEIVDYAVENASQFMGADHAYFQIRENKFYIVDNNSKNGTWLNKNRLQPSVPYELHSGDVVKMADEVFDLDQR